MTGSDKKGDLLGRKISIFLVEDHEIFRMGLKQLIIQEKDLCIAGESDDANKAWEIIKDNRPDLVVVDISLKESNGLDLVHHLKKLDPNLPVLVLSMHDESLYAERVLNAGARGYIMKQETSVSIITAIRQVLKGKIYVSENITGKILNRVSSRPDSQDKSPIDFLSDRELMVLQLIGEGNSSGEIAKKINVNIKTVGTYKDRIKEKLNLKNVNELIRYAVHWIETKK
jgi:DNA-binding NarL/FixJ family response regulator